LPGTIIHELAHMLTAGVMLVPVGEMEFLPEVTDHGVKLGSVQIGRTDPIRRMLIGVAPVLVGLGIIINIIFLVQANMVSLPIWLIAVAAYLLFEISNTMFSSKKDLEGTVSFLVAIILIMVGIFIVSNLLGMQFSINWLSTIKWDGVSVFLKILCLSLLFPIGVDLGIILLSRASLNR
jgi:hypothetical protein